MSAINVLEAMNLLKPEQVTVQNLLIENGQLIETVAEYQRMGKIVEATKYQERLHRNLIYLAKLADSTCSSHLLLEIGGAIPPTNESPPPAEPLLTVTNSANPPNIVATIANAGLPHQQQCQPAVSVAIVSQTSPPSGHAQQRGISTTPPAHGVQYQFPSPPQPSPHTQTTQQQQPTTANLHYSQSHQQQAVPFQRNLNVPSHPMLFQHQQNVQLSQQQQQMGTQQHSVVYAGGHAIPTQHHQQYSAAYPLLQQQQQSQQFPPSTGAAFAPMVIPLQNDPIAVGIRQQHQQVYQHTPSHSALQHGTSHAGGYLAQQK